MTTDNLSDRELLELAAKALGKKPMFEYSSEGFDVRKNKSWLCDDLSGIGMPWSPLTDDGDALRLAVRLNIYVWCIGDTDTSIADDVSEKHIGQDRYQATRRAIVRAAAEIGKEMQ